jgi:hypothetical protein
MIIISEVLLNIINVFKESIHSAKLQIMNAKNMHIPAWVALSQRCLCWYHRTYFNCFPYHMPMSGCTIYPTSRTLSDGHTRLSLYCVLARFALTNRLLFCHNYICKKIGARVAFNKRNRKEYEKYVFCTLVSFCCLTLPSHFTKLDSETQEGLDIGAEWGGRNVHRNLMAKPLGKRVLEERQESWRIASR